MHSDVVDMIMLICYILKFLVISVTFRKINIMVKVGFFFQTQGKRRNLRV